MSTVYCRYINPSVKIEALEIDVASAVSLSALCYVSGCIGPNFLDLGTSWR
jgi:hypothetical protein